MARFKYGLLLATLVLCGVTSAFAQRFAVSVDHVEGAREWNIVNPGQDLRFLIRFKNDSTLGMNFLVGFRVYSYDGAVWQSTETDTIGYGASDPTPGVALLGRNELDLGVVLRCHSCNGVGSDTTGILANALWSTGMPAGFDDTAIVVIVRGISASSIGKHICIDSSAILPAGGGWKWVGIPSGLRLVPFWNGPLCFTIDTICCLGSTGNVDNDPNGSVDISDIVAFVDHQFNGAQVSCEKELNIDGSADEVTDLSDLIWLIDFVFFNGPAPLGCL